MSTRSPIVCGVDTSSEAATAARVAGRLAALLDRPLALVYAAPKPWVSERPFADSPQRLEQQASFDRAGYQHEAPAAARPTTRCHRRFATHPRSVALRESTP